MIATIAQLTSELVTLIKSVPTVGEKSYSVFSVEDLDEFAGVVGFPIAGVSYEGAARKENSVQATSSKASSAALVTLRFMLIIAIDYKYASNVDTKPTATNLLDEVRQVVLGYQGANTRPWRFTGELPLETRIEGAIMYGQMWETDIPVTGNSPT